MRYSVKPAGLLSCSEELEEAVRRLRRDSENLESTIQRLKRLSYMGTVCVQLQREQDKLEERIRLTLTMAQAARRCRDTYQSTEQQIIDDLDCPRHVLTAYGEEVGGQIFSQDVYATATMGQAAPAGQARSEASAALDWGQEMEPYAEAFSQAGINVRLGN